MSDAALDELTETTRKGFDLEARVKGQGLRRGTVKLYLNAELGAELGDVRIYKNDMGVIVQRVQTGVLGELDKIAQERTTLEEDKTKNAKRLKELDAEQAKLEEQRDEILEKLDRTGLTLSLRAVPDVVQKGCERKARASVKRKRRDLDKRHAELLKATEIDEEALDEVEAELEGIDEVLISTFHLMAIVVESITDNESGDMNTEVSYHDIKVLKNNLPPSQWDRLDRAVGVVQFTDSISRMIEKQEDFS